MGNKRRSPAGRAGTRALCAALLVLAAGGSIASARAQAPGAAAAKAPAPASAASVKPLWASLSPEQQHALAPLAGQWDGLGATRKQKWLEIANHFAAMKPEEQARMQEKMREWVRMTPDERRLVRENYTRAKKLDVSQKSAQWEQYQQLPEEQKRKLAAEAAKTKKPLTNLPPAKPGIKTVAPLRRNQHLLCPAGSVSNPALATPAPANSAPVPACVASTTRPAPAGAAGSALPPAASAALPTPAPASSNAK